MVTRQLRRTRHRVATYGLNHRGHLVELRVVQRPTFALAVEAATAASEGRRGAIAYLVELDDDDSEILPPIFEARFGLTPAI